MDHGNGDCPLGNQCPSPTEQLLEVVDLHTPADQRYADKGVNDKDMYWRPKLHMASLLGKVDDLKVLLPDADLNESVSGFTPLHLAVYGGHTNVVDILLSDGRIEVEKNDWALDFAKETEEKHNRMADMYDRFADGDNDDEEDDDDDKDDDEDEDDDYDGNDDDNYDGDDDNYDGDDDDDDGRDYYRKMSEKHRKQELQYKYIRESLEKACNLRPEEHPNEQ